MGYRDHTVDDLLAFHIAFGKTVPDISVNAVANLGYADVRFPVARISGRHLEHLVHSHRTQAEFQRQQWRGVRAFGIAQPEAVEPVLEWKRWVMVHKHDLTLPAPATVIPELPAAVPVERLHVPEFVDCSRFETALTGGQKLWDDYAPGERINHPAGMTVDDSDHTLATKLYQNNARLHFDAQMMKDTPFGRRLMYGGHVISVCRALSYDGLENALCIAAINAGTHSNPSFGGDTFYTWTEVLERWELPDRKDIGALRLRMVGLKNLPAKAIARHPHRTKRQEGLPPQRRARS